MPASPSAVGLRERKKAKTRAAIQEHALRLFRSRGYEETTVEDIAEAAEISPSTFFRYFPTKEDVVMYDVLDDEMLALFRAQPLELSPIEAFRKTLHEVFDALPADAIAAQEQRDRLAREIPQLRARMLDEFVHGIDVMVSVLAERAGRRSDDPEVKTVAGAIAGVLLIEWAKGKHRRFRDYFGALDRSLDVLESGLPLLRTAKRAR